MQTHQSDNQRSVCEQRANNGTVRQGLVHRKSARFCHVECGKVQGSGQREVLGHHLFVLQQVKQNI